jgi:hypothetical protein
MIERKGHTPDLDFGAIAGPPTEGRKRVDSKEIEDAIDVMEEAYSRYERLRGSNRGSREHHPFVQAARRRYLEADNHVRRLRGGAAAGWPLWEVS